jgi:hypothetical protein
MATGVGALVCAAEGSVVEDAAGAVDVDCGDEDGWGSTPADG